VKRTKPGVCQVCGCTDEDCTDCVDRTGEPCAWVEPALCSACVGSPKARPTWAGRLVQQLRNGAAAGGVYRRALEGHAHKEFDAALGKLVALGLVKAKGKGKLMRLELTPKGLALCLTPASRADPED